jgi:hypothetical protein
MAHLVCGCVRVAGQAAGVNRFAAIRSCSESLVREVSGRRPQGRADIQAESRANGLAILELTSRDAGTTVGTMLLVEVPGRMAGRRSMPSHGSVAARRQDSRYAGKISDPAVQQAANALLATLNGPSVRGCGGRENELNLGRKWRVCSVLAAVAMPKSLAQSPGTPSSSGVAWRFPPFPCLPLPLTEAGEGAGR